MSDSKFPMMLFWGSNLFCFFNKAYKPFLNTSSNHRDDLGKKGEKICKDSWEFIKSKIDQVINEEKTIWSEEQSEKGFLLKCEYNPVRDQADNISGVLVICRENSLTTSGEQKFKKITEEKNKILESITDGFYEINENWVITNWNSEAEKLLDLNREDMLGKEIWEIFPEAKKLKLYSEYQKVMNKRVSSSFEEYYEPWGKWFTFDVYPSTEGISVFFRDITEQRRLQLINERTEEISGVAGWEYDVLTEKVFMTPNTEL